MSLGTDEPADLDFDHLQAWSRLGAELDRGAKTGRAEDRHGAAIFWLLSGHPGHGIDKLRALLDEHPKNVRIRADLVAAYLRRAADRSRPLDGVRALEVGLRRGSSSPQLRTNLLIALHRLGLRHLAAESLELLTAQESDPAWMDWLDTLRLDLEKPSPEERWRDIGSKSTVEELRYAAKADPLRAYDLVEALWLRAAASEELEEAEALLNEAEAIGLGLVDARPKVGNTTSRLRRILEDGGEPAERLRDGLETFRQGRALYEKHDTVEASQILGRAADLLDGPLPLLARTADLLLAHCEYRRSVPEGMEALQRLQQTLDPFDFPHLAGRAAWILGSGRKTQRRYQEALDHYRLARPLLKRASGSAEAPFIDLLIAETLGTFGDLDGAWRRRVEASAIVAAHAEPERRTAMLMLLSWALAEAGFEHVLHASLQELAAASRSVEQPYWQANAHLYAVLSQIRLGGPNPSFASLDVARAADRQPWSRALCGLKSSDASSSLKH